MLFASKKVYALSCKNFRSIWENSGSVELERMDPYNNWVRLAGRINGVNYQVRIEDSQLAGRVASWAWRSIVRDNDSELERAFCVACACADLGVSYEKYAHLAGSLVLNYNN